MRVHFMETMTNSAYMLPLAKAAEELGYSGFMIPDSLFYPRDSDSSYFYTSDGSREFLEDKEFIEPFILASAIAGVTTKIEISTFVVKLPVRPPVYSAKLATSVAVISGNRFNFGVGLSVWPDDYKHMGINFERRGKRLDECIEIIRGLSTGEYFEYHGAFYDFGPIKICPVPTKPIPILGSGHTDAALKRSAERCDGWMHAGSADGERIEPFLTKLEQYRKAAGTDKKPFRIFIREYTAIPLEAARQLRDLGIEDLIVTFRNFYTRERDTQSLQQKIDELKSFADSVIANL